VENNLKIVRKFGSSKIFIWLKKIIKARMLENFALHKISGINEFLSSKITKKNLI